MKRTLTIALPLLTVLAALTVAAPDIALGQPLSIEKAGSAQFPQRAFTLQTPQRVALEADEVVLRENGEPVDSLTVESARGGDGTSFGTVLVIDTSKSMDGSPIVGAMRAARAFADHRAPGQQLGVVTFNNEANLLLPLTDDPREIAEALRETPRLGPSTHLYDATEVALSALGEAEVEAGSIIVLSDGADTGSAATSAEVVEQAAGSGTRMFAVGLRSENFDRRALARLAAGGTVADAASPKALARIFDRFGAQLAAEHLIGYESTAGPGETITVEVEVAGVPGVAQAHYAAPTGAAPEASSAEAGFWGSPGAMIGAIALAAALLGLGLFVLVRPHRETVRDRLARFIPSYRADDANDRRDRTNPVGGTGPLSRISPSLDRREWWGRFQEQLEIAEIETPAIRIAAGTLVGTGVLALFLAQALDAAILIPLALIVPLGVRTWFRRRLRLRRREFADQLADNLQLVASALRAGQSMAGALSVVVEEAADPARREFRRIVNDERLGVPLEEAIRDVARRMDNRDLEQVALVATIQRETGGNTAEILDQVIVTIRERGKLRRLMETLTAQGRLTQVIVSALPLALLVAITLLNRAYMTPLFETTGGRIALGIGAVFSIAGSLIIKRIVEVRV